jgi:anti-sigma28 factor (negative regulator of flagellin synthesis)
MRIESIPPNELLSRYSRIRGKTSADDDITMADETQLTDEAKTFSTALKAAKASIETRTPEEQAHIDQVAQQVKDGTYSVSSRKVAEKILGL